LSNIALERLSGLLKRHRARALVLQVLDSPKLLPRQP
jgi:hypothetical protein